MSFASHGQALPIIRYLRAGRNDVTSLVCWVGVDSRGPASVYLGSDSRISWTGPASRSTWDVGRKLFASRTAPDVLGYMGQVLFPSQVLPQIIDIIDAGLLYAGNAEPDWKRQAVFRVVRQQFENYPDRRSDPFTIVYCTRFGSGMNSNFHISAIQWKNSRWAEETFEIPRESTVVQVWGSGQAAVERWYQRWAQTRQGGQTSRSVFSGFCDSLANGEDPFTGGAPQLVGAYRQEAARRFGIIYQGQRYLYGTLLVDSALVGSIEWRNALFERCDGSTGVRLGVAQRHGRPKGLGKAV